MARENRFLISQIHQTTGWREQSTAIKTIAGQRKAYTRETKYSNVVDNQRIDTEQKLIRSGGKTTRLIKEKVTNLKKGTPIVDDYRKALMRVAVVVPIWMAARAVISAVTRTISGGIAYWKAFDAQLRKSEQVIHGFAGTLDQASEILSKRMETLSRELGVSMENITKAFYRFGTVGLDFETSMHGAETATKLATVMFGDSDRIARILAQSYRLLGHTIDSTIPPQERMRVVGAQIYKLWQTNAFELDEFSGALERFLPTAHAMNFTLEETVALLATLHTAGIKGTRTGRLLSSSFQRFLANIDEVATSLGVYVNPALDTTHDALMKVLMELEKLNKEGGNIPIEALEKMADVFGGIRQREAILGLTAVGDTLRENQEVIKTTGKAWKTMLDEFDKGFNRVMNSVSKQMERFTNLRQQLGMAFIQGMVGGDDFEQTLKNLNKTIQDLIPVARGFGTTFKNLGEILRQFSISAIGTPMGGLWVKFWEEQDKKSRQTSEALTKYRDALHGVMSEGNLEKYIQQLKTIGTIERIELEKAIGIEGLERSIGQLERREFLSIPIQEATTSLEQFIEEIQDSGTEMGSILNRLSVNSRELASELEKAAPKEAKAILDGMATTLEKQIATAEAMKSEFGHSAIEAQKLQNVLNGIKGLSGEIENNLIRQTQEQEKQAQLSLKLPVAKRLAELERERELILQQAKGMSDLEMARLRMHDTISDTVEQWNKMIIAAGKEEKILEKSDVIALAMQGRFEEIAKLMDYNTLAQENVTKWAEDRNKLLEEEIKLQSSATEKLINNELELMKLKGASAVEIAKAKMLLEEMHGLNQGEISQLEKQLNVQREMNRERKSQMDLLIDHQLELMKLEGASTRQLLEARTELERQAGIEIDMLTALDRRLQVEREITKEKKEQKGVSSDTVKLYEIGVKYGTDTARVIAEMLRAWRQGQDVTRQFFDPNVVRIFEREFGSIFQQIKAMEFFGLRGGRGMAPGAMIPIEERERFRVPIPGLPAVERIVTPEIPIDISSVININVEGPKIIKMVVEAFKKEMQNKSGELYKAMDQVVEEH